MVVKLTAATIRKDSLPYDLPIVLAGFLPHNKVENTMVIGERLLDGLVRHVCSFLPIAAVARADGFKQMFVPEVDEPEGHSGVSMGKIFRIRSSPKY